MFWIFTGLVGLMVSAVTLGKYAVWFGLLKAALILAVAVIAVLGATLVLRQTKKA